MDFPRCPGLLAMASSESLALQKHYNDICDSGIVSTILANVLFSAELIDEHVHDKVTDELTRKSSYERIQEIMKAVKAIIKLKNEYFDKFLEVLSKDIGWPIGVALAEKLSTSRGQYTESSRHY